MISRGWYKCIHTYISFCQVGSIFKKKRRPRPQADKQLIYCLFSVFSQIALVASKNFPFRYTFFGSKCIIKRVAAWPKNRFILFSFTKGNSNAKTWYLFRHLNWSMNFYSFNIWLLPRNKFVVKRCETLWVQNRSICRTFILWSYNRKQRNSVLKKTVPSI